MYLPTAAMVATGVIVPIAPTAEAPANSAPPPMIPKAVTEYKMLIIVLQNHMIAPPGQLFLH